MIKNISDFIKQAALRLSHQFSSIQVQFPNVIAKEIYQWGLQNIPEDDLIHKGREDDIHVTLKYGLHYHDPFEIRSIFSGCGPIELTLGPISVFENSGEDVVKIDINSPKLHELNKKVCEKFPYTDKHPKYVPHCTLAYVKPGCGKKYAGRQDFMGKTVKVNSILFSGNDKRRTELYF